MIFHGTDTCWGGSSHVCSPQAPPMSQMEMNAWVAWWGSVLHAPFECPYLNTIRLLFPFIQCRNQAGKPGSLLSEWLDFVGVGNIMEENLVISTSKHRMSSGLLMERKKSLSWSFSHSTVSGLTGGWVAEKWNGKSCRVQGVGTSEGKFTSSLASNLATNALSHQCLGF